MPANPSLVYWSSVSLYAANRNWDERFETHAEAKEFFTERNLGKEQKWKIISEVWVEMLAYAATHCRGNHHAQQLRKGGELLTHVWLLMAHLGITEQFQIYRGHAVSAHRQVRTRFCAEDIVSK
ncbi:hypothetical protein HAX54_035828 [Datura stramonium]|uniref:Uncharacterized protein n=1 Tax=Datura stramonium TaxID=4076 RepID=A0ABS8RM95_DATST|nr:hypothetical protein [Datura stramonium]